MLAPNSKFPQEGKDLSRKGFRETGIASAILTVRKGRSQSLLLNRQRLTLTNDQHLREGTSEKGSILDKKHENNEIVSATEGDNGISHQATDLGKPGHEFVCEGERA